MAINPETGIEDPNYTEPVDETVVDEPAAEESALSGTTDTDTAATTESALATSAADTEVPTLEQTAIGATGIEEASTFVSPESTVAGQLEKIFKQGSPLQDLAETRSREQASALGMSSSSAAIGAGQRALYDSALPIAQQDAQTNAEAQAREQTAYNAQAQIDKEAAVAGDLTVQKAQIAERQQTLNDEFAVKISDMAQEDQVELLGFQNEYEKEVSTLNAQLNESLTKLSLDADVETTIINQTHDMLNNVQISWQQMLTNDNFLNNFESRTDMLASMNNLLKPVKASIAMSAQQAGVYDDDFASWINTMMADSAYT